MRLYKCRDGYERQDKNGLDGGGAFRNVEFQFRKEKRKNWILQRLIKKENDDDFRR